MKALPLNISVFVFVGLILFFYPQQSLGFCSEQQLTDKPVVQMATLGGARDTNAAQTDSLARFAVDEHNNKQNALLELVRVVKAKEQVVAGTLHHLTLEVVDAGKKKLYEAKVWVKPWLDFKELQEFNHVGDVPSFTSSDLGVKKDEQGSGWQSVPVHDPVVQEAAHHAIKTIQQRSNSLVPYELSEVVDANAEVVETSAKFDMLLKVKRGGKEEKFKVEVHRSGEGVDINEGKREVGEAFGMTDFINPEGEGDKKSISELVKQLTGGGGVDYSFECTGVARLVNEALEATKVGVGKMIMLGAATEKSVEIDFVTLLGSREFKYAVFGGVKVQSDLPLVIQKCINNEIQNLDKLLTHEVPLEDIEKALALLKEPKCVKVLISF